MTKYHANAKVSSENTARATYIPTWAAKLISVMILNNSAMQKFETQLELAAIEFAVPIT